MKGRVLITEKEDEEMLSIKGSRMFRLVFISVLFLGFTVHLATAPPVGAKMRLTLGTSTIGGTWYVTGTGLAEIWNREIPEITVTLGGGGSGGNNPKLLASKEFDIALTTLDMFWAAKDGKIPYKKKYDLSGVRSIMLQHMSPAHWIVLAKSPIRSIRDLKGKKVAVGTRGKASNQRALWVLEIAGLKKGDFKIHYIGDQQACDAIAEGRIDCYANYVGVPNATVLNMATTTKIRLVELTKDEKRRLFKKLPFMSPTVIKGGTYPGVEKDISSHGVPGCLQVQKEVPEDVVYKMVKAIDENWDFLYKVHKAFKKWRFDKETPDFAGQPLHPGAVKFYKEKGLL